jgi:hypothetical protein
LEGGVEVDDGDEEAKGTRREKKETKKKRKKMGRLFAFWMSLFAQSTSRKGKRSTSLSAADHS